MKQYRKPEYVANTTALPDKVLSWFQTRGITQEVIRRNQIGHGEAYFPQVEEERTCIQFPYLRGADVVNIKYRTRRLDDEHDFVRFEVAEALRTKKCVIPVPLNGTAMPQTSDLPADLQALVFCQALQLSDASFDRDMASLIQTLGGKRSGSSSRWKRTIGFVLLTAIFPGWLYFSLRMQDVTEKTAESSISSLQPVTDITGTWQGPVVYEWDNSQYTERFQFRSMAGVLTGTASFLTVPRGIQALELKDKHISFETHTKGSLGEKEINYVHRYRGQVQGDTMRLVMQTTGGYDAAVPREIVAQRISRD